MGELWTGSIRQSFKSLIPLILILSRLFAIRLENYSERDSLPPGTMQTAYPLSCQTLHDKVRKMATDNYSKYDVDRARTDARLLLCKTSVHPNGPDTSYKVYTRARLQKNSFKSEDLVNMRNMHFSLLQDINIQNLEEITVFQASRQNTGWTSKGATV